MFAKLVEKYFVSFLENIQLQYVYLKYQILILVSFSTSFANNYIRKLTIFLSTV